MVTPVGIRVKGPSSGFRSNFQKVSPDASHYYHPQVRISKELRKNCYTLPETQELTLKASYRGKKLFLKSVVIFFLCIILLDIGIY